MLTHPDDSGERVRHWGDQWHFAISRMVVACRAYGLRPIDGPFGDISDPEGYIAVARSVASLGCEGKWAIHPSQIPLANEIFTPSEPEVTRARRIMESMQQAAAEGKGAVSLDGRMIDAASIRQAQTLISKIDQIETLSKSS
jgi:malyl-CoA/(S)-citramalyl-CoA lyase